MEEEEAAAAAGPGAGLVFWGGEERAVGLAKSFWNSVSLQPPLESRLAPRRASAGTASPRRDSASGAPQALARRSHADAQKSGLFSQASVTSRKEEIETQGEPEVERVDDQKARYLQKAKRREEILALLRKQREERIVKEAVSRPHKPKTKMEESSPTSCQVLLGNPAHVASKQLSITKQGKDTRI